MKISSKLLFPSLSLSLSFSSSLPFSFSSSSTHIDISRIGVYFNSRELSSKFNCVFKNPNDNDCNFPTGYCDKLLIDENRDDGALELRWLFPNNNKNNNNNNNYSKESTIFRIDFTSPKVLQRLKKANTELVCKAIGKIGSEREVVFDLTAGLGRDSLLLASVGYSVVMCERNYVLFLLLQDALNRLENVNPILRRRIILLHCDSVKDAQHLIAKKDSIIEEFGNVGAGEGDKVSVYLDPMYAENSVGKRSLVKKDTQILHRLVDVDDQPDWESNNKQLLDTARLLSNARVVVKRSLKASPLNDVNAHESIKGSTHRFDIYFKNRN